MNKVTLEINSAVKNKVEINIIRANRSAIHYALLIEDLIEVKAIWFDIRLIIDWSINDAIEDGILEALDG